VNQLSGRLSQYDGCVWWLPLSYKIHHDLNKPKFFDFLQAQNHKPYNFEGAILSALNLPWDHPDMSKLFCSQLAADGLEAGGIQFIGKPDFTLPGVLCGQKIYSGDYYQLFGDFCEINEYDTLGVTL
jgi:hypothetical protein